MNKDTLKELIELNLIPTSGVVLDTFKQLYSDTLYCDYKTPSEYVTTLWEEYKTIDTIDKNNNTNGKVFESIFATILYREKIYPLYAQAKIAFVPNINFDFVVYSQEYGPISLSLKVSLRERYKQADLEAMALKYVHRKSKNFLFTLDKKAALSVSEAFNNVIQDLKKLALYEPEKISILTSRKIIKPNKL